MTNERCNIEPGEVYGTEIKIEILSVEVAENQNGLRKALARVLSAIPHWQDSHRSIRPGDEFELQEIMDDRETQETHWNLIKPEDLWFILGTYNGEKTFEHYR